MNKNNYVAEKKVTVPTAYPDMVEQKWSQIPPYTYRTNSQTDPVSEAWGFVLKYSLWAILAAVIAIGLALRNNWDAGLLLVAWGIIATAGYVVIFLLLSVFTPEGVAVVHEFFDYLRYRAELSFNLDLEKYRIDRRIDVLLATGTQSPALPEPKMESPHVPFWQPDADFVESIESELEGAKQPVNQDSNAVALLSDFLIDLYDHSDELLRNNETINMQAGVTLPWSKRSDVPAPTKAAISAILQEIEPPLFVEFSNGRVVKLNTKQYPTKQHAIAALSI